MCKVKDPYSVGKYEDWRREAIDRMKAGPWTLKRWLYKGKELEIVEFRGHYNGYVVYPVKPCQEEHYHGIIRYVPVHGGITWAQQEKRGFSYGFDTAHGDDDKNPRWKNLEEMTKETQLMADAIDLAVEVEPMYLSCDSEEEKASVIQLYHDVLARKGIKFELTDNFGAMISVLCGSL